MQISPESYFSSNSWANDSMGSKRGVPVSPRTEINEKFSQALHKQLVEDCFGAITAVGGRENATRGGKFRDCAAADAANGRPRQTTDIANAAPCSQVYDVLTAGMGVSENQITPARRMLSGQNHRSFRAGAFRLSVPTASFPETS
jgi:hypothetical protein